MSVEIEIEPNVRALKIVGGHTTCSTRRQWRLEPGEILWFQSEETNEMFVISCDAAGALQRQTYSEFLQEVTASDLLQRSAFRYWAGRVGFDRFIEACRPKTDEVALLARYAAALERNGWVGMQCDANCPPGKYAYDATALEAQYVSNAEGMQDCWNGLDDDLDSLLAAIVAQAKTNEELPLGSEAWMAGCDITRTLHEKANAIIRPIRTIVANMSGVFDTPEFANISWRPWHYVQCKWDSIPRRGEGPPC